MKHILIRFIDIFYPPFRRLMPLQTFRYAACGGANTVLGLTVYYIGFHYIFTKQNFDAGFMVFKPHNAALFLSFVVSFCVGFLLNKYVVFTTSYLRGRIQLFRYFLSFFLNLVINYFLLNLLVEVWHVEAFLAQLINTVIIITIGYLTQKHFTFKTKRQ
ncbi:MAG: GtrA family protein [Ferruginibacter sp.]